MTSLLNLDRTERASAPLGSTSFNAAAAAPAAYPAPAAASSPAAAPASTRAYADEGADFEIVFGRRQMASTGLVLMVALACVSGVSYLIGKSAGAKAPANAAATAPAPVQTPAAANPPATSARPAAAAVLPPKTAEAVKAPEAPKDQAPLFAEAVSGKVYIQVGAIEKGLAGVWAEGLRTHGLEAFVSTGPSDKMWRVLIGPLPDPQAYEQAKTVLDQLGIATFGRKYTDASH